MSGDPDAVLYDDWLGGITRRFQEKFDKIEITHNFEYGPEFEIAIAEALRELLPRRYGVCRGYVVSRDGQRAGDDIIIFDAQAFPTLRAMLNTDLARKESVPAEAVLAYIEAKHTLKLLGEGGQSLEKACSQVAAVKQLPRPPVDRKQVIPGVNLKGPLTVQLPVGLPDIFNPYYTAVWARNADESGSPEADWHPAQDIPLEHRPDAILTGTHYFFPGLPRLLDSRWTCQVLPLMTTGARHYITRPPSPWGAALAHLLWAIQNIRLGELPWQDMFQEQLADGLAPVPADPVPGSDGKD